MSLFGKKKNKIENVSFILPPERRMSFEYGNLQGIGSRSRQEDSFAQVNAMDVTKIKDEGLFFTVCDGMGGMRDGKLASETAVDVLKKGFMSLDRSSDISSQLESFIVSASAKVEDLLEGEGGSTVIVAVIYDEKLYFASVGDSYFYLKRGNEIYLLNWRHNLENDIYLEKIRNGDTNPFPARENREAEALTSFLGMSGLERIDRSKMPIPLKNGDVLLSCSDGIGGVLDENELNEILEKGSAAECCMKIEQRILEKAKPHQDNFTGILVKCIY